MLFKGRRCEQVLEAKQKSCVSQGACKCYAQRDETRASCCSVSSITLCIIIYLVLLCIEFLYYTNIGPLNKVSNIMRTLSTISWIPPFSLDLTNIEPDIISCVEVYNITCRRGSLLVSDCSVTESHLVDESLQSGHIYSITITPRSNVETASNGTSLIKRGRLPRKILICIFILIMPFMGWSIATKNYYHEIFSQLQKEYIEYQGGSM